MLVLDGAQGVWLYLVGTIGKSISIQSFLKAEDSKCSTFKTTNLLSFIMQL